MRSAADPADMFRYALKSLRANLTRFVSTATAVVVGIGFLAAGLMLTDAMQAGLTGDVEEQYRGVDLAVVPYSPGSDSFDLGETVPADVLGTVRGVEGVAAAAGEFTADIRVLDASGESVSSRTTGRVWIEDEQLNPFTLVEGRAPGTDDEVVLDTGLADEAGVGVGDEVGVRTPVGERTVTVTGLSRFGSRDALDVGGTASFAESAAATVLSSGSTGWSHVIVRTDGDPDVVAEALTEAVPGSLTVESAEEFVEAASEQAAGFIDFLRPVLQGFAYLSLFVCSFVIFNTFSVVVTQRYRELALIRAIGGTPGQVRRSLLSEGVGIGLGASVVGIAAGALFALGIQAVLGWFDLALPGAGVRLSLRTVLVCVVVGTIVTALSVLVPAIRAGRTKPVEAMRASAVDTSGTSKVRAWVGGSFLVLSLVLLGFNQFGTSTWKLLAPGALFLFVGLVVGGPLLARLFGRASAPVLSRFGLSGRLAADNTVRNPKRTATTANALVIGLFLVTLVTVAGEAIKTSLVSELNTLSGSDFLVIAQRGLDEPILDAIDRTDGVTATARVRTALTYDESGLPVTLSTTDFAELEQTAGVTVIDGSLDPVRDGDMSAVGDFSELFGGTQQGIDGTSGSARVGRVMGVRDAEGEIRRLEVGATLKGELDTLMLGFLLGEDTFAELVGERPVSSAFVRVDPGRADDVGLALERLLDDYTGIEVAPGNFIGQIVAQVFDFLLGAINALLGMSVVIALVGIVNTMTLSIFERRQELGLVRALGMTRRQVAQMIRVEAVLIGLLGTVIGMAAGILLGWVVVSSLDSSLDLAFNWARVGLIFVIGVVVGMLASIMPTRRATRLDMLEAMRSA